MLKNFSLKNLFIITLGGFLVAVSVYYLMIPAGFATGSLSGLVMVLSNFIPLPISLMTFILNTILLVLGFLLVGRDFGIKTIYASNLLPFFLWIFERVSPGVQPFTDNIVLSALATILVASAGMAMLFNTNASSGGLDIVAMILSKYFPIDVGRGVSVIGGLVALSGFFVYDVEKGVTGLLTTFFMGYGIDIFIGGFNLKKHVEIVVPDPEPVRGYIIETLHRGCTVSTAEGGYSGVLQYEIKSVLSKNECAVLLDHLKKENIRAFVSVTDAADIYGLWNDKNRRA